MKKSFLSIRKPLFFFFIIISFFILHASLLSAGSTQSSIELFSGKTMGTTYHIKVDIPIAKNGSIHGSSHIQAKKELKKAIEERLGMVNKSMSVYKPDSEISTFNRAQGHQVIEISPEFHSVMQTGQNLYQITRGAWDATLKPLVDLWGFGTENQRSVIPPTETIREHLKRIGFNRITIHKIPPALEKNADNITLDLGSIAKGFGVDTIAGMLRKKGYDNYLVEIGGEVVGGGEKQPGTPWMVGVTRPDKGGNPNAIHIAFPLQNQALATSGDYRNFITVEGKNYSHIIDPVTGYPVTNCVVSTSVIAADCTFADGLATALMVMGPERGIELVDSLKETECLIVVRSDDGNLTDYFSRDFPKP